MINELIRAFFLIFAAEMGDKTQIIAMTFATQYKVKEVLMGVFLGVFLNHGLAILLGRYISKLIPMNWIQLIAGFMFVIFGLLALREEDVEDTKNKKSFGPIFTVALAFFVGELGDKTQLTAMTLSAEGNYPFFILIGTTLGMMATSGLGIYVGSKIGEKISDIFIKIVSSLVFVFFGTLKLYSWLPKQFLNPLYEIVYFGIIISIQIILIRGLILKREHTKSSSMKEVAATLYIQTNILNKALEEICLGEEKCGNCSGINCIIGYTKKILKNAKDNEEYYIKENIDFTKLIKKDFDKDKVIEALSLIIVDYIKYGTVEDEKFIINQIKGSLESILFGRRFKFDGNLPKYLKHIMEADRHLGENLENSINMKLSITH
jgi:putative Ca2+/H+ antiporter (TMEM165/GDT1 family)